jgi:uncharacterized protein (TIGR02246 family)
MNFANMIQEFLEAIKRRDLQQILSLFSIDEDVFLILLNGAPINGRSAFINLQAAWLADPDWKLEYKILRTIETAELAYALLLIDYSDPALTDQLFNKPHYLSLVFTRKNDRWCLVHDQTTVVL